MTRHKYLPGFQKFWDVYPQGRRNDKPRCFRKWQACGLEKRTDEIIALLASFCESDQYLKDDHMFVPAPLVWLNREPWEGCDIPPAHKKLEAEHQKRIAANRRAAGRNPIAREIAKALTPNEDAREMWWASLPKDKRMDITMAHAHELDTNLLCPAAAKGWAWKKREEKS